MSKNSFARTKSKFTRFCDLRKKDKAERYIKLKNKIRKTERFFGTTAYTSHLDIFEQGRNAVFCQQFAFSMLGLSKQEIYYVELSTANSDFLDRVSSRAVEMTTDFFKQNGVIETDSSLVNGKFDFQKFLADLYNPPVYEALGGRTKSKIREEFEAQIIKDCPPDVFESITVDCNCEHAIYVKVVIDAPRIDHDLVLKVVELLRSRKFEPYLSSTPVPREKLPQKTLKESMIEHQLPGYQMGWKVIDGLSLRLRRAK